MYINSTGIQNNCNNRQKTAFKGYRSLITEEALTTALKSETNPNLNIGNSFRKNIELIKQCFENNPIADALVMLDKDIKGKTKVFVAISPSQRTNQVPGGFGEYDCKMISNPINSTCDRLRESAIEYCEKLEKKYKPKKSRNI